MPKINVPKIEDPEKTSGPIQWEATQVQGWHFAFAGGIRSDKRNTQFLKVAQFSQLNPVAGSRECQGLILVNSVTLFNAHKTDGTCSKTETTMLGFNLF